MVCLRRYVLLFGLLILHVVGIRAQLGQQLTSSPTPKFSHQYTFDNSDRYYFIDTTFNNLYWYHQFNNQGEDLFDYVVLGSMGTPANLLTIPKRIGLWDYYQQGAYQPYMQSHNDIPYYQVNSPITEGKYWKGYDRGQSFNIYHTQNITKNWNAMIGYNRLNDLGFYTHNRNIKSKFTASMRYDAAKGGYSGKAHFYNEKMSIDENGGLVNDSSLSDPVDRVLIPVNLLNDSRLIKNLGLYVDQKVNLLELFGVLGNDSVQDAKEKDSVRTNSIAIGHKFQMDKRSNSYTGYADVGYYENYYYQTKGEYIDTSGYKTFANTIYLRTDLGRTSIFTLEVGVKNLVTRYGGRNYDLSGSNWGLSSLIAGNISDRISVNGYLDYIATGPLKESLDARFSGELKIVKGLKVFGGYNVLSKYPEFFKGLYYSNNFIWNESFSKELTNEVVAGLKWGVSNRFEVKNMIYNNHVYFNENSKPVQSDKSLNVLRLKLIQNFKFWGFVHQDNQVYYHLESGATEIMPLPEVVTRNSLYFEFHLFDRVLKCISGVEMKYYTSYLSPSYNPAIGRFYVANEREIGNYPVFDVFINFKLRSAMIFLKYEHVNEGMNGYNYFGAVHYPIPDRVLRFGLTWRFFN